MNTAWCWHEKNIIKYTKTNLPRWWLFEKGWWMLNIYGYQVESDVRGHILKTCDGKEWALTEWNQNHSSVQKQTVHLTQALLWSMKYEYKIPAVYRRHSPCLLGVSRCHDSGGVDWLGAPLRVRSCDWAMSARADWIFSSNMSPL